MDNLIDHCELRTAFTRDSEWVRNIYFYPKKLIYIFDDAPINKQLLDLLIQNKQAKFIGNTIHQGEKMPTWRLINLSVRSCRFIKLSDRFNIFKRDNYKCVICGNGAKDGVKLEIDHIVPISKGGLNHIDNYQTLCSDCNRGKSDKSI